MIEDKDFEKINFKEDSFDNEYYNCVFTGCDFSELALYKTVFDACRFEHCNFSLVRFSEVLRDVSFVDCKITGADFSTISRFSADLIFENSHLVYTNFSGIKLRNIIFRNCKLNEASFDDADISSSVFDNCDMDRASFGGTNLEKVDFSTAFNYIINPTQCKLKKTIFSESGLSGLVAHLNIVIK